MVFSANIDIFLITKKIWSKKSVFSSKKVTFCAAKLEFSWFLSKFSEFNTRVYTAKIRYFSRNRLRRAKYHFFRWKIIFLFIFFVMRKVSISAGNTIGRIHEHHLRIKAQKDFKNLHYLLFFWRAPHKTCSLVPLDNSRIDSIDHLLSWGQSSVSPSAF